MKRSSIVIFVILTLISCNQNNSINEYLEKEYNPEFKNCQKQKLKETELKVFYSQIRLDTTSYIQEIKIGNINHKLELKLYSLNDSSIVLVNEGLKEVYHNSASEIVLTKYNDTIIYKKLTKEVFKDSIDVTDYDRIVLSEIGYKNIRSNRIYFTVGFDNAAHSMNYLYKSCDVGIFYRTEKKGQVSFNNFKNTRE
ncbi:hypothetical protein SAMN04489796_111118 [Winogradskyella thalassocola]|uniref:Uncharacterized protein n=1 Tax=Winogradskyella thalassocola TaxID=262004 RepID=A0A1G8KUV5_9FLAO|nr:hypothetical protein SAMN04489796_111118 [Winogradskyella thalassocola]